VCVEENVPVAVVVVLKVHVTAVPVEMTRQLYEIRWLFASGYPSPRNH
jgi:hypothetical protein